MRLTYDYVKGYITGHGDKLKTKSYKNYRQQLDLVCHKCHKEYKQTFQSIQKGFWCTEDCKRENRENKKVHSGYKHYTINDVTTYVHEQGDTLLSKKYTNGQEKLDIQCGTCNKIFQMGFTSYKIGGQRCPPCKLKNRTLSEDEFRKCVEERGDVLTSGYKNSRTKVCIKCNKCNNDYQILANQYRRGGGCKVCAFNDQRLGLAEAKKRIEIYGDKLLSTNYVNRSTPLQIKCGLCNSIFHKNLKSRYIPSCRECNATSLEKLMHKYLKTKGYEYTTEKSFDDCRSSNGNLFRFDFYIQDKNLLVEADGCAHFQVVKMYGPEWFKVIQARDIIKTKYCKDNSIKLIRVCPKDMRSEKLLDELFDRVKTENIVYSDNKMYEYITKWY